MFRLTIAVALLSCAFVVTNPFVLGNTTIINDSFFVLVDTTYSFCGGSVINENFVVVTAAHCLSREMIVRVGSTYSESGGEVVAVRNFKVHEQYNSSEYTNDIALIKLDIPVTYSDKIKPIELATEVPKTGSSAYVTGWGKNRLLGDTVQVAVITVTECKTIRHSTICTSIEVVCEDASQGDSGSPLVSGGKLLGVLSRFEMRAPNNCLQVYASVPEYRLWIEKNAAEL